MVFGEIGYGISDMGRLQKRFLIICGDLAFLPYSIKSYLSVNPCLFMDKLWFLDVLVR